MYIESRIGNSSKVDRVDFQILATKPQREGEFNNTILGDFVVV
jgi:hypothetical protein